MNSIIQLRGHVDKLRMWMETSSVIEKEKQRNNRSTDDDMPALFSPINPPKLEWALSVETTNVK
jgi:hypothetical protein